MGLWMNTDTRLRPVRSGIPLARTFRLWIALALLPLIALAVQAPASAASTAPQRKLTVAGSSLLAPLVSDVARRFERMHSGVKIDVRPGGSGQGVAELRSGSADIGMVSRALINSERDLFPFHIARDGLAVVVHRDNPVKSINALQLTELLRGRLVNWKALGGRDAPVILAWRSKGQGSVEFILEHLNLSREQIGPHRVVIENADAIRFAAGNPNAVTLASVGDSERSAHANVAIKLLAYDGVAASNRNLQNRSYALSRPLTLLTRLPPEGLQKQFLDYALSAQVVDLQVKNGFVPYQE